MPKQLGSSSSEKSSFSCGGVGTRGPGVLGAGGYDSGASLVGQNLGLFVAVMDVVWFGQ